MSDPIPPPPPNTEDKGYTVRCISMYDEDLERLDAAVAALQRRGARKINRSRVIRIAIATLDAEQINLDSVNAVP